CSGTPHQSPHHHALAHAAFQCGAGIAVGTRLHGSSDFHGLPRHAGRLGLSDSPIPPPALRLRLTAFSKGGLTLRADRRKNRLCSWSPPCTGDTEIRLTLCYEELIKKHMT